MRRFYEEGTIIRVVGSLRVALWRCWGAGLELEGGTVAEEVMRSTRRTKMRTRNHLRLALRRPVPQHLVVRREPGAHLLPDHARHRVLAVAAVLALLEHALGDRLGPFVKVLFLRVHAVLPVKCVLDRLAYALHRQVGVKVLFPSKPRAGQSCQSISSTHN